MIHSHQPGTATGAAFGLVTGIVLDVQSSFMSTLGMSQFSADIFIIIATSLLGGVVGYVGNQVARVIHEKIKRHVK